MNLSRFKLKSDLSLSDSTMDMLDHFVDLTQRWSKSINLIGPASAEQIWHRHILDSAQLIDVASQDARSWLDLGSGGGFPGMVVAILASEIRPELRVCLVESDQRKAAFLRSVARETGVSVTVHASRVEDLDRQDADILSARALAPLPRLLSLAVTHVAPHGVCLFPKGTTFQSEVDQALENWSFTHHKVPSVTQPGAMVLVIRDIQRVEHRP